MPTCDWHSPYVQRHINRRKFTSLLFHSKVFFTLQSWLTTTLSNAVAPAISGRSGPKLLHAGVGWSGVGLVAITLISMHNVGYYVIFSLRLSQCPVPTRTRPQGGPVHYTCCCGGIIWPRTDFSSLTRLRIHFEIIKKYYLSILEDALLSNNDHQSNLCFIRYVKWLLDNVAFAYLLTPLYLPKTWRYIFLAPSCCTCITV